MKIGFNNVSDVANFILEALKNRWPVRYAKGEILIEEKAITKEFIESLINCGAEIEIEHKDVRENSTEEPKKEELPKEEIAKEVTPKSKPEDQEKKEEELKVEPREPNNQLKPRKRRDKTNLKNLNSLREIDTLRNILSHCEGEDLIEMVVKEVGWTETRKSTNALEKAFEKEELHWKDVVEEAGKQGWQINASEHRLFSDVTTKYFLEKGFNVTLQPFIRLLQKEYCNAKKREQHIQKNVEETGDDSEKTHPKSIKKLSELPEFAKILVKEATPYAKISDIWKEIMNGKKS